VSEPGKEFVYNNRAVDLLSGVVRRAAGLPLNELVSQKLFTPLGIDAYYWMMDPDGNPHGCAELILDVRDLAKVGQLMLNGGVWKGKRVLSKTYIDQATKASAITESSGASCGWLWWNVDPWFTLTENSLERLRKGNYTEVAIDRVRPLLGAAWPNYREMEFDFVEAMGGERGFNEMPSVDLQSLADNAAKPERQIGFYANGWGGQWLLILPKQQLVAARLCGNGFHETEEPSKYEMGSFLRLVQALVPKA
jgi:CubicO group peptidase (beta-lactamase class C family)